MLRSEESPRLPDVDLARSALFLDIDGTVLDIAASPEAVVVPPELVAAIKGLSARTEGAVAFVSGRTLADIDRLFSPLKLPAIGCHGAQFRPDPHGPIENAPPISEEIRNWAKAIGQDLPGIRVEDKQIALSIHYRLAPEAAPAVVEAVASRQADLEAAGLQVLHGKAVIDIKPRSVSKGTEFARMMGFAPFRGRTPVFCGDDTTDEDVFRILPSFGGRGFSVGRKIVGTSFTFDSPRAVRCWLGALEGSQR